MRIAHGELRNFISGMICSSVAVTSGNPGCETFDGRLCGERAKNPTEFQFAARTADEEQNAPDHDGSVSDGLRQEAVGQDQELNFIRSS
jgi:hypothetical protein